MNQLMIMRFAQVWTYSCFQCCFQCCAHVVSFPKEIVSQSFSLYTCTGIILSSTWSFLFVFVFCRNALSNSFWLCLLCILFLYTIVECMSYVFCIFCPCPFVSSTSFAVLNWFLFFWWNVKERKFCMSRQMWHQDRRKAHIKRRGVHEPLSRHVRQNCRNCFFGPRREGSKRWWHVIIRMVEIPKRVQANNAITKLIRFVVQWGPKPHIRVLLFIRQIWFE